MMELFQLGPPIRQLVPRAPQPPAADHNYKSSPEYRNSDGKHWCSDFRQLESNEVDIVFAAWRQQTANGKV
jgi:hypothetical protein